MAESDENQWKRHMRDEATAQRAQQTSAGPDHHRAAGPGLYGDHGTNIYVREAVLAERERCARQAAGVGAAPDVIAGLVAVTDRDREVAAAVAKAIVAAIRSD